MDTASVVLKAGIHWSRTIPALAVAHKPLWFRAQTTFTTRYFSGAQIVAVWDLAILPMAEVRTDQAGFDLSIRPPKRVRYFMTMVACLAGFFRESPTKLSFGDGWIIVRPFTFQLQSIPLKPGFSVFTPTRLPKSLSRRLSPFPKVSMILLRWARTIQTTIPNHYPFV